MEIRPKYEHSSPQYRHAFNGSKDKLRKQLISELQDSDIVDYSLWGRNNEGTITNKEGVIGYVGSNYVRIIYPSSHQNLVILCESVVNPTSSPKPDEKTNKQLSFDIGV